MSNFDEYMARKLKGPEHRRRFGASLAKAELGVALGKLVAEQERSVVDVLWGVNHESERLLLTERMLDRILAGEANPRIGEVGAWLGLMGYQVRLTIEPLERGGKESAEATD